MKQLDNQLKMILGSEPEEGQPIAHIRVMNFDDYHDYGTFEFGTQMDVLSKMVDMCQSHVKNSGTQRLKLYKDLIYMTFRPSVDMDEYILTLMKFLCLGEFFQSGITDNKHQDCIIIVHIHLDDYEESGADIIPYKLTDGEIERDFCFELVSKSDSAVKMTLPTKLKFLAKDEMKCFVELIHLALTSGQNLMKFTFLELYDLWEDFIEDVEEYEEEWVYKILDRFVSYNLIDLNHTIESEDGEGDVDYDVISVRDLDLYEKMLFEKRQNKKRIESQVV